VSAVGSSAGPGLSRAPARSTTRQPTLAYVLHSHDWSESSLILDLFTRDQGRVVAVAKGAKRPYSQLRPVLMPFQQIAVTFGAKQGPDTEVWLLRQAEWSGGPAWPGGAALLPGFYANELLMRLLPRHDRLTRLWSAYAGLLPALTLPGTLQASLRAFELMVLRQLGHLPDLSLHSASGLLVDDDVLYTLSPDLGIMEADGDAPALPGWLLRQLEAALAPAFDDFSTGLPEPLMQTCVLASSELRSLLRAVLHYHVGPQPLRTRQLMMDLTQST
jgi:DNA repair protein RecO (recombination protein O)